MKHVTLFVLAAAVGSVVPVAAAAGTPRTVGHHKTAVTRLRHELQAERTRLARKNAALDQAKTALAASSVQVAQLQAQVGQTSASLAAADAAVASVQQQLTAADGQVGSLQAQLAAVPSPLAVAVTQVREAASWASGGAAPTGQAVAEAAMDYTIGHVSLGVYGYLEDTHAPLPSVTEGVDAILAGGAGYCGHAARVFGAIVVALGYQVRGVWFTYDDPTPDGHYAVEVFYAGGWHFFDPTFGKFWTDATGDVLSIASVRANGGTLVKDNVALTNIVEDPGGPGGDYSWFESDPSVPIDYQPQSNFVG